METDIKSIAKIAYQRYDDVVFDILDCFISEEDVIIDSFLKYISYYSNVLFIRCMIFDGSTAIHSDMMPSVFIDCKLAFFVAMPCDSPNIFIECNYESHRNRTHNPIPF